MTFTIDSRKFEYVHELKPSLATPAKQAKRAVPTKEEQERSDEPAAAAAANH